MGGIKGIVEGNQSSVNARIEQIVGVILQTHTVGPLDQSFVTPHKNVCANEILKKYILLFCVTRRRRRPQWSQRTYR